MKKITIFLFSFVCFSIHSVYAAPDPEWYHVLLKLYSLGNTLERFDLQYQEALSSGKKQEEVDKYKKQLDQQRAIFEQSMQFYVSTIKDPDISNYFEMMCAEVNIPFC